MSLANIIQGGIIQIVGSSISKIGFFLLMLWLARKLTVSEFGIFGLVYSLLMMFTWLSTLGFSSSLLKLIPKYSHNIKEKAAIIKSSTVAIIFGTVFFGFVLFFYPNVFMQDTNDLDVLQDVFFIVSLSLAFSVIPRLIGVYFQANNRMRDCTRIQYTYRSFFVIISIVAFVAYSNTLIYAVYGLMFGLLLTTVYSVFVLQVNTERNYFFINSSNEINHLRYTIPMFFSGLAFHLLLQYPNMVASSNLTSIELGLFVSSVVLSSQIFIVGNSISASLVPVISRLHREGKEQEIRKIFLGFTKALQIMLIPFFIILFFFGESVMAMYGDEYQNASPYFVILGISWLFYLVKGPISEYFQATERQGLDVKNHYAVLIYMIIAMLLVNPSMLNIVAVFASSIIVLSFIEICELYFIDRINIFAWLKGKILLSYATLFGCAFYFSETPLLLLVSFLIYYIFVYKNIAALELNKFISIKKTL